MDDLSFLVVVICLVGIQDFDEINFWLTKFVFVGRFDKSVFQDVCSRYQTNFGCAFVSWVCNIPMTRASFNNIFHNLGVMNFTSFFVHGVCNFINYLHCEPYQFIIFETS